MQTNHPTMTVENLMNILKQFPPQTPVLVDGYEAGYDNPTCTTGTKPMKLAEASLVYGAFEEAGKGEEEFHALVIERAFSNGGDE